MESCCHEPQATPKRKKIDWIFWISVTAVALGYIGSFTNPSNPYLHHYSFSVFEILNKMWLGLGLGILFVGFLGKIPQDLLIAVIGRPYTFSGVLRATFAGVLLDMCSHGILMVGAKFYKKGAGLGQTMAFLISSPWNSLSLTVILASLIGVPLTMVFLAFSMVIAVFSGWLFDRLVLSGVLPRNPVELNIPDDFSFSRRAKEEFQKTKFTLSFFTSVLMEGIRDSRVIVKWLLFGITLTALLRVFLSDDLFQKFMGPSLLGMVATLFFATVLEVCSEGAAPVAADIVNRASAPGNGFLFLMAGVSTDYTEILVLRDTTRSWKIAFFLPLVTLPQIVLIGYLINRFF